jgi:hypothetical protein
MLLAVLAVHNFVQLVAARPGPDRAVDFRPLYLGASIALDGGNPYDDRLLKQTWIDTARREGFTGLSLPGLPNTPLVYPPWALPLFVPFAALPWLAAAPVWYTFLAALLLSTVLLLAGLVPGAPRIVAACDLLALALGFKAIDWAALVGQPLFLCLALGAASWALSARGRDVPAGIALGMVAFKIHLALPFALLAVFRRKPRTLIAAVLTVAVLGSIFVGLCDNPASAVANLADNLTGRREATYDPQAEGYPLSHKLVWRTSLTALAELFAPGAWRHEIASNAFLLATVVPFWIVPFARRHVSPARAFSIFAVLGLLATPHYHYDCLVLLPLYLLARETDRSERIALLVAASPLLLPINGVLASLSVAGPLSLLYFNVQLSLLAVAAVLTWGVRRGSSASALLRGAELSC